MLPFRYLLKRQADPKSPSLTVPLSVRKMFCQGNEREMNKIVFFVIITIQKSPVVSKGAGTPSKQKKP